MENIRYIIASCILIIFAIIKQVHIIQLNSYNLDQQLLWYKKNVASFVFNISLLISVILFYELGFIFAYYLIIISFVGLLIESFPRKQKKKLVYTARIKRLIFICILLFATAIKFLPFKFTLYVTALSPVVIFVAYLISLPIENAYRRKFMNEAKAIIDANDDLCVIGITGSFGKTSVKYYLDKILKSKYLVCKTPESFNTAMGATLTIKNDLRNIDEIFICEMGARRVGDIKEICDIVSPNGAIITDVGNMHLDTFKTIENVLKTKFELVESSVKHNHTNKFGDVPILVNGDNELIRKNVIDCFDITSQSYIKYYGLSKDNDFYADDIISSVKGTKFRFSSKTFGSEEFETKLLGKYNIMNLVAAISYSLLLGVDMDTIKNAVRGIEPVMHRLQLLPYDIDNLIIDDAYNSNPLGARNAADVISYFDGYTKVIITPGMVELSDKQDMENEKFAEYAGTKVDYAIVVGNTNKASLNKGFEKSLDKDKVVNIDKVDIAIFYAINNINGKKVILLENDLSDNY